MVSTTQIKQMKRNFLSKKIINMKRNNTCIILHSIWWDVKSKKRKSVLSEDFDINVKKICDNKIATKPKKVVSTKKCDSCFCNETKLISKRDQDHSLNIFKVGFNPERSICYSQWDNATRLKDLWNVFLAG